MSALKRFNREITNFQIDNFVEEKGKYNSRVTNCSLINYEFTPNNLSVLATSKFVLNFPNSDVNTYVSIFVTNWYPFKPPKVLVNGYNYLSMTTCHQFAIEENIDTKFFQYYYLDILSGGKKSVNNNIECP